MARALGPALTCAALLALGLHAAPAGAKGVKLDAVGPAMKFTLDLCRALTDDQEAAEALIDKAGLEEVGDRRSWYAEITGAPADAAGKGFPETMHLADAVGERYYAKGGPGAGPALAVTFAASAATCLLSTEIARPPTNTSRALRLGTRLLKRAGLKASCHNVDIGPPVQVIFGWGGPQGRRGCAQKVGLADRQCCWLHMSYAGAERGARLRTLVHLGKGAP
ncbi:MAG: hypothetical protein AAF565_11950 [Pseudomonadota bacterium]